MTNEELKKKIVEILDNNIRWQPYYYISRGIVYEDDLKNIADALIAAGLKFDVNYSFTAAFNSVQAERERDLERRLTAAEHRAEVAERELLVYKEVAGAMLCEIGCSNEGYCPEFYKDPECKNCTKKKIYGNFAATSPCLLDKYIQQAERELAEEKKDD